MVPLSKPAESLDMIKRFVADTPLGLPMTGVIPSAVPPQAALDDLERHHLLRLLSDGSSSNQTMGQFARAEENNQSQHLSSKYCQDTGVDGSLRGTSLKDLDLCRLRLRFQLGPLQYPVSVVDAVVLDDAYRRGVSELLRQDMMAALEEYLWSDSTPLATVTVDKVCPIVDESVFVKTGLNQYRAGWLQIEMSISDNMRRAIRTAKLLGSPAFDESIFFDSGIILSKGSVSKFVLVDSSFNDF
ncbi:unnamed protein product [Symbiodinium microadriaticum]|nr:unnamed protein product [Symbiodinium microadriaticum]